MERIFIWMLLLSVARNSVNGLDMCRGPFEPPKIVEVTSRPEYDSQNKLIGARFSYAMVSKYPVYASWWIQFRRASEDDENLRSSSEVANDRYVFRLHIRLDDTRRKTFTDVKYLESDNTTVTFSVDYGCNVAVHFTGFDKLKEIGRIGGMMPTITEMPRQRYYVDDGVYTIKAGFSGPGSYPPKISSYCTKYLNRSDGELFKYSSRYSDKELRTGITKLDDVGITEATCTIEFGRRLESLYVVFETYQQILGPSEGSSSIAMNLFVNLRRRGVETPAILVDGWIGEELVATPDGTLLLPTTLNTTQFHCSGDAEDAPYVAAAKVREDGHHEILTGDDMFKGVLPPWTTYTVPSPRRASEGDDYICTAASGQEVASSRFKVVRYVFVEVKKKMAINMTEEKDQYDITCEATGVPQPRMKFLWTPGGTYHLLYGTRDVTEFLKKNEYHELETSDDLEMSTWVNEGTTYGQVKVKGFRNVLRALPEGLYESGYRKRITLVCLAYNQFSFEALDVAYYANRTDRFQGRFMDFNSTFIID